MWTCCSSPARRLSSHSQTPDTCRGGREHFSSGDNQSYVEPGSLRMCMLHRNGSSQEVTWSRLGNQLIIHVLPNVTPLPACPRSPHELGTEAGPGSRAPYSFCGAFQLSDNSSTLLILLRAKAFRWERFVNCFPKLWTSLEGS